MTCIHTCPGRELGTSGWQERSNVVVFIHDLGIWRWVISIKREACALGRPRGMWWGGRREGGSGWGTHVNPLLIHVNIWQKPLQYCKVISLQLIKINEKEKKREAWLRLLLAWLILRLFQIPDYSHQEELINGRGQNFGTHTYVYACKTCSKVWIVIVLAEDAKLWWRFSVGAGLRRPLGQELPQPSLRTREGRGDSLISGARKMHLPSKHSAVQFLRPQGKPGQKNTGRSPLHALWLHFPSQAGFLLLFRTVVTQAKASHSLCVST